MAAVMIACPARAENLADLYTQARQTDAKYRAARYEFEAVGYTVNEARSSLLPTVGFELSHSITQQEILSSQNAVFGSGSSNFPTNNQTLSIVQPIFKLGAVRRFYQANAVVAQAAAVFGDAEQDLMLRVASAYLAVLAAQDALAFAGAEREAIGRNLDLVQQRYNSGQVTIVNLHDARARQALKESDLVAARNELDDKLQALREITGTNVGPLMPLPQVIPLPPPDPADMKQWVDIALKNNYAVAARTQAVDVARQEVERQKAAFYPSVDLSLNSNKKKTGGSLFGGGSDVRNTEIMLRMSVPIFDGGLTRAQSNKATSRYLASQEELERERRQVERQTRAAYQAVTGGIVRVRALDQSVVSLESARKLKEEGYKAGLGTVLAVLDAERDLYAAKRDAAQSRYDFVMNTLRLKQAVGSLGENDLGTVSKLMR